MRTIVLAGGIALLATLFGTRVAIRILVKKGYGQLIRDDGPTSHHVKRGTPTMGGLVIIAAVLLAYFGSHLITLTPPSASALLILFLFTGLGVVGFLDDFIKISKQRSLGLRSKAKIAGQSIVAVLFALGSLQFPDDRGITPASKFISFLRDIEWLELPVVLVVIWVMLLIAAASNGVNLTDGLDGLASGACVMIFGAYTLVNIWQFNQSCAYTASAGPKCYEVRDPYDLAVVAIALTGACFGFLWWNAEPAKIFMGDTGSLSLGGALAGMAIFTRTELLLVILGGLLVIEVMSVILQVGFFKLTKGKRLFKMSPIHHHFELLNWAQVTIVMRFWIIAGLFVSGGLGIFYAEWVSGTVSRRLAAAGGRHLALGAGPRGRRRHRGVRVRRGGRAAGVRRPGDGAGRPGRLGQPRQGHPAGDPRRHRTPRSRLHRRAARRRRPGDHHRMAGERPAAGPGGGPRRADLERGRAGLAAQPADQGGALAGDHRYQRQDHDHPDAGVDPVRGGAAHGRRRATSAGRSPRSCWTGRATTCSRSSCPATSCTGRTPWPCTRPRCSTSSRTTWSGTARTPPTPRPRPPSIAASRPAASTTWPIRRPSGWWSRPR